jgi:hypothetical protein
MRMPLIVLALLLTPTLAAAETGQYRCLLEGDGTFSLDFTLDETFPEQGSGTVIINGGRSADVWFLRTEEATLVFNSDDNGRWLALFDHNGNDAWGSLLDGHGPDMYAVMRGSCSPSS